MRKLSVWYLGFSLSSMEALMGSSPSTWRNTAEVGSGGRYHSFHSTLFYSTFSAHRAQLYEPMITSKTTPASVFVPCIAYNSGSGRAVVFRCYKDSTRSSLHELARRLVEAKIATWKPKVSTSNKRLAAAADWQCIMCQRMKICR